MITDTGKSIIGKYLLGQAPAYASYIAIGCGAKPLDTVDPYGDYSEKNNLDFEMLRIPISSRGFINDEGLEKIVLTAELPTEERYEISEIGIFSAGSNPSAGAYDSKTVFAFTQQENWQYHTASAAISIPTITTPLDESNNNIISTTNKVFQTNADNSIFYKSPRPERYERCRFLNNIILIRGDDANISKSVNVSGVVGTGTVVTYTTALPHTLSPGDTITVTGVNPSAYNLASVTVATVPTNTTFTVNNSATGSYVSGGSIATTHFVINTGSNHIHLTGADVNFTRNSPIDELRLAFSLVSKDGDSSDVPDKVRILVDFATTDSETPDQFARFEAELLEGDGTGGTYDFSTNRYYVITKQLQQLYQTQGFTWNAVTVVKIYVSVLVSDTPSDDYYVALDAIRLENIATTNPLYGLTGYSVIKTPDAETIIKSPNTSNYVEFRFSIGVT